MTEWYEVVEIIQSYVVRISTPDGSGTGFLISNGKKSGVCGFATAAHVVNHAHYWEQPVRVDHLVSGQTVLIRAAERAVFLDEKRDTAAILFNRQNLVLPEEMLQLSPKDRHLRVGNEIGWLGFPAVRSSSLCFFGGRVSAWVEELSAYLIDGVAINGVSGGPAFHVAVNQNKPWIMGVVSAYMPNRATGEVLPGLSVVRNVAQFHELAPTFESLEEAKSAETPPSNPPPPNPEGDEPEVPSRRGA